MGHSSSEVSIRNAMTVIWPGGGITYGYDWILSPHWNLEAAIGIGYARLWYKESPRIPCEKCYENKHKNYFGPTKAAVSLIYVF